MKTAGGLRRLRHRGGDWVARHFLFVAAAYNLVRLRSLPAAAHGTPVIQLDSVTMTSFSS